MNFKIVFVVVLALCYSQQRPCPQTLCGALRREANWKCLLLSLLIYGCLAAVTWCRFAEVTKVVISFSDYPITRHRAASPCEAGYLYIPVCFLALLYLVYLAECWHRAAQLCAVGYEQDLATVSAAVQYMRQAQPVVWWKAVCYHYVRRKRQVTRYRHGEGYTATQVYYERVNSHAASADFSSQSCGVRDISRDLVLDSPTPVTRIRFSKGFAFSNVEAASEFEEQRARFFAEHERYDDYMEMREGLDLRGGAPNPTGSEPGSPDSPSGLPPGVAHFRELVVAYKDTKRKPWYCRPLVFWIASLLLLSWPLRVLQEYNTSYVHYQVTKLFGVNYEFPPGAPSGAPIVTGIDVGPPLMGGFGAPCTAGSCLGVPILEGRMSRGSTLDSGEWDCCIRDNCAMIPSYSEALLMDSARDEQDHSGDNEDDPGGPEDEHRSLVSPGSANNAPASQEDITAGDNGNNNNRQKRRRRSWGGIFRHSCSRSSALSQLGCSSCSATGDQQTTWRANIPRSASTTRAPRQIYYSSPLAERCPGDPFQGRSSITPSDDNQPAPPPYEEALSFPGHGFSALALPVLGFSRLRRSLTDRGDIFRRVSPPERVQARRCSETASRPTQHSTSSPTWTQGRPCINMETSL